MTDMVEKVADALRKQRLADDRANGYPITQGIHGQILPMDKRAARVAIRALMEPTEEMYDAAWREIHKPEHGALKQRISVHGIRTLINALYPAMLKAVLDDDYRKQLAKKIQKDPDLESEAR